MFKNTRKSLSSEDVRAEAAPSLQDQLLTAIRACDEKTAYELIHKAGLRLKTSEKKDGETVKIRTFKAKEAEQMGLDLAIVPFEDNSRNLGEWLEVIAQKKRVLWSLPERLEAALNAQDLKAFKTSILDKIDGKALSPESWKSLHTVQKVQLEKQLQGASLAQWIEAAFSQDFRKEFSKKSAKKWDAIVLGVAALDCSEMLGAVLSEKATEQHAQGQDSSVLRHTDSYTSARSEGSTQADTPPDAENRLDFDPDFDPNVSRSTATPASAHHQRAHSPLPKALEGQPAVGASVSSTHDFLMIKAEDLSQASPAVFNSSSSDSPPNASSSPKSLIEAPLPKSPSQSSVASYHSQEATRDERPESPTAGKPVTFYTGDGEEKDITPASKKASPVASVPASRSPTPLPEQVSASRGESPESEPAAGDRPRLWSSRIGEALSAAIFPILSMVRAFIVFPFQYLQFLVNMRRPAMVMVSGDAHYIADSNAATPELPASTPDLYVGQPGFAASEIRRRSSSGSEHSLAK